MDEELFNLEIRKLLKKFGVTAQREIEQAVRAQLERGTLTGRETLDVHIRMTVDQVVPEMTVDGTIALAR
jgi:ribosomal protein L1